METINITVGGGINNKARSESMPEGTVRSATNVDIDNSGNARLRPGQTSVYTGTGMHSVWHWDLTQDTRYFVEEGTLKRYELDGTATTIKTGVGNEEVSYTYVAGCIYFSNSSFSGSIIDDSYQKWGIDRPTFQPTASASTHGGMFAGDYQVAITWLRNGEESGTVGGVKITLSDGEGIHLSDFPAPPSDVTQVAVYVSSTNGKTFWLYSEYPANISDVFVGSAISTIPLRTQFADKPDNFTIVTHHYGRILCAIDNRVHRSTIKPVKNYGLFRENDYWYFPIPVTGIISVPGVVYVGTANQIFRISNIDQEGPVVRTLVKEYGMTLTPNYPMDKDNTVAFVMSTKGKIALSSEGITEINFENVATDQYGKSSMALLESDGIKRLVSVSQTIVKASDLKANV